MLLQGSTACTFEHTARNCVCITCVSSSPGFLCIITWLFLLFHQKKNLYPWGILLVLTQIGLVIFDISANKGISQDQKPLEQSKSLAGSLPNAPENQPCPSSASVRFYFKMLHVSYVQNWFLLKFWSDFPEEGKMHAKCDVLQVLLLTKERAAQSGGIAQRGSSFSNHSFFTSGQCRDHLPCDSRKTERRQASAHIEQ